MPVLDQAFVGVPMAGIPVWCHPLEKWLEARKHFLTSTDAAGVMAVGRFKSPLTVFLDKTGQWPEPEDSDAMEWGRRLEEPIAEAFAEKTGRRVVAPGRFCIIRHPTADFLATSVDRLLPAQEGDDGPGILEVKTASDDRAWKDGIPLDYQIQVQHQFLCTGLRWGIVAVLFGGRKYRTYTIQRHEAFQHLLVDKETAFWKNYIIPRVRPEG